MQTGTEVVLENVGREYRVSQRTTGLRQLGDHCSPALSLVFFPFLFFIPPCPFIFTSLFAVPSPKSYTETQHVKLKNGTALGNWSSRLLSPFLSFPLSDLISSDPWASQKQCESSCSNPTPSFLTWYPMAQGGDGIC